jgi:CyaY protein
MQMARMRNRSEGFTIKIRVWKNSLECSMTESEFLALAEQALGAIEASLEQVSDSGDLDVECSRSGNVLEIEFIDNGSKIIVNSQAPMQEMWVAARSGGFHYKRENGQWINTRDGSELFAALSKMVSEQGGASVVIAAK